MVQTNFGIIKGSDDSSVEPNEENKTENRFDFVAISKVIGVFTVILNHHYIIILFILALSIWKADMLKNCFRFCVKNILR